MATEVAALAVLFALAASVTPAAEVSFEIVERQVVYTVKGGTATQRVQHLDQLRRERGGSAGHGSTQLKISGESTLRPDDDHCTVERIRLRAVITTEMPQWNAPNTYVRRQLRERWLGMLEGLRRHEEGHRQHMLDEVGRLLPRLHHLPLRRYCHQLEQDIAHELDRMEIRLELRTEQYDRRTANGQRQGARL